MLSWGVCIFFCMWLLFCTWWLKANTASNAMSDSPVERCKAQKFLKTFACSFSIWSDVSSFLGLIFWDLPELEVSVSSALLLGLSSFHEGKSPVFYFSAGKTLDFSLTIWVTGVFHDSYFYGWLFFLVFFLFFKLSLRAFDSSVISIFLCVTSWALNTSCHLENCKWLLYWYDT